MKSFSKPTDELVDNALNSVKTDVERHHFYTKLENPEWIEPLCERGVFAHPPNTIILPDGYIQYPFWPELQFLKNVTSKSQERVVDTILKIPKTDNPRIYEDVIDILLSVKPEISLQLKNLVLEYVSGNFQFLNPKFERVLNFWSDNDQLDAALELAEKLIQFSPDPLAKEKQELRRKNPRSWASRLESRPRLESWAYQRLLENGIKPLSAKEPYKIAIILIRATANMIYFRFHMDQIDEIGEKDLSHIWCPRVNESVLEHVDPDESLVHSLTLACENVYDLAPEHIEDLDREMRKQRWNIFARIRQHLFALHPNEKTKQWIRKLILDHTDYSIWEHHFEFQRMIRRACECLGTELITEAERVEVFDAILDGPSKDGFKEWMGGSFTEELFEKRKRYFHRMQLTPFTSVLFGEYLDYYRKINENEESEIVDDDYAPYKPEGAKWVVQESPKTHDELGKMSDKQLLSYINEWDNASYDPNERWTEISFEALAETFQTTLKDTIFPSESRFNFWIENREQIDRPIYLKALVLAISEHTKSQGFESLDQSLDLCEWILSTYQDSPKENGVNRSHESRELPDWQSSRRAVGDFIGLCVKKDIDVPIEFRQRLLSLLEMLCTQYDRQLDDNEPILIGMDDPLTEAINCTRSRALESIVDYGYWVRRQSESSETDIPEVFKIFDSRFDPKFEHPLTLPEYAIIGLHFVRIFGLSQNWTAQNSSIIFPKKQFHVWSKTFGNFLQFSRPYKPIFGTIKNDLEFAIKNIDKFEDDKNARINFVDRLGEHLFLYYLWGLYPLTGRDSLLSKYYESTRSDISHWSNLFDYVGRSLKNSGNQLEKRLEQRAIEYFSWRLEVREPTELKNYTFWLEAECMDLEWRLRMYSQVLDICNANDIEIYSQPSVLQKMLKDSTALVVECFAKLTDLNYSSDRSNFILSEEARPILQIGLRSTDPTVRENAERARANLLQRGSFDLSED
ncbi:MAG: hypothetical protein F4Z71_09670 [Gammaproteobacteria bacterium]|nr:hypothetical protein [Gammaproteobacteria bacterium]MYE29781.1 hypothetical protein [Gammaproteobacteria bacterium]